MRADNIRSRILRMDWMLVLSVLLLMVIGVMFIYSAGFQREDLPVGSQYRRQLLWMFAGILAFLSVMLTDYHKLGENAHWIYLAGIFLLVFVLLFGQTVHGSSRWINVGGIKVQPSEFAKITVLIGLAAFLSRPGRDIQNPRSIGLALLISGIPFVLIAKEPDLGTAAVLIPVTMVMLYVAGMPMRIIWLFGLIGLLMLPLGWLALGDYQKERILVFFDPGRDPLGAGWNKMQSEIAVGSGGLSGKGFLQGTQNILGFLPRTVAPTDFIYSVIAEEMGFVGSSLLVALYAALFIGIGRAALLSRDKFGRLIVVGVLAMLFSHVSVNIAMTVGLMPITGLPLPLISYGGSFMISTMTALGLVQSVYVRRYRRG